MSPTLLYLLKANGALVLFAAAYFGLLRQLTFFVLNRAYLVFALLFSACYPAFSVPGLWPAAALPAGLATAATAAGLPVTYGLAAPATPAFDWQMAGLVLYGAGAAVLLGRLLLQLLSVWQLRKASRPALVSGQPVRALAGPLSPFSFWRTVYLNPAQHPAPELTAVLRHELVHVRQWHTLDVLLSQLVLAAAWLNPAAWLLRRALLDNLEYLADHAALQTGLDRRAYQYSLLRLSQGGAGPALVSHFTFLTLKNRIAMMNAPASAASQTVRYLLAVPLVLALALGLSAAQAQSPAAPGQTAKTTPKIQIIYLDGKLADKAALDKVDPKSIAFINVLDEATSSKVFGTASGKTTIVVTKQNQNSAAVVALNDKIARVAPLVPGTSTPASVNVLVPAALAYITKTYPNSRIIGVTKLTYPSTGQTRYRVELAEGRRPHYAFFDEQGNASKL